LELEETLASLRKQKLSLEIELGMAQKGKGAHAGPSSSSGPPVAGPSNGPQGQNDELWGARHESLKRQQEMFNNMRDAVSRRPRPTRPKGPPDRRPPPPPVHPPNSAAGHRSLAERMSHAAAAHGPGIAQGMDFAGFNPFGGRRPGEVEPLFANPVTLDGFTFGPPRRAPAGANDDERQIPRFGPPTAANRRDPPRNDVGPSSRPNKRRREPDADDDEDDDWNERMDQIKRVNPDFWAEAMGERSPARPPSSGAQVGVWLEHTAAAGRAPETPPAGQRSPVPAPRQRSSPKTREPAPVASGSRARGDRPAIPNPPGGPKHNFNGWREPTPDSPGGSRSIRF
jgi:hypothetical protein